MSNTGADNLFYIDNFEKPGADFPAIPDTDRDILLKMGLAETWLIGGSFK